MDRGFLTFAQIREAIQAFHQDHSSTFQSYIDGEISLENENAALAKDWGHLRRLESNLTFTAGQLNLYLPPYVDTLIGIVDTTNNIYAEPTQLNSLIYQAASVFETSGVFYAFAPSGEVGRKADFASTPETLTVVSSSSADTATTIRLRGIKASGEYSESVTLTGTTPIATSATFTDFLDAATNSAHAGFLTISGTTSGVTYAIIPESARTVRYKRYRLLRPPSGANSYAIVYKKAIARLINDDDSTEIPIGPYLIEYGKAKALFYDKRGEEAQAQLQVSQMKFQALMQSDQEDGFAQMSRPQTPPRLRGAYTIYRP